MKLIILGDSSVGKTCLLTRYFDKTFRHDTLQTLGFEHKEKTMEIDDSRIKLQTWDTAGQERF